MSSVHLETLTIALDQYELEKVPNHKIVSKVFSLWFHGLQKYLKNIKNKKMISCTPSYYHSSEYNKLVLTISVSIKIPKSVSIKIKDYVNDKTKKIYKCRYYIVS